MAELSGFWTTVSSGAVGHQQASYTQVHWSTCSRILSAAFGFEGVAPGFENELEGTDGGANTVDINTGGGVVDGKWFHNDSSKSVAIPSAVGAGNTRIDRIVLRADWANYQVTIYRIAGTDAATPSAPSVTQTSGTTYDIMLYQVLVDTSGNVTLTDEREWARGLVDDATIEWNSSGQLSVVAGGIGATELENDSVTNAKLADPYDILGLIGAGDSQYLTIKNGYITFPVPDIWNGKSVSRLTARLATTSSSGDVTIRLYNVTDSVVIATVTITAGNTVGYTESITNPSLATNDILRLDVTADGTDTQGLTALVKVDKS